MLVNARRTERRHFAVGEAVEFLIENHSVDCLSEFDSDEPDDSFMDS